MKYVVSLLLGFVLGAAMVAAALYYNPLTRENVRVPLTAAAGASLEFFYGSKDGDTILRTNHSRRLLARVPEDIPDLWEPALKGVSVWLTVLRDVDRLPVGLGLRMSALSEDTRLLTGDVLLDSAWNVHLPGRGSFFIDTVDDVWPLARAVVLPAWRAPDKQWRGSFSTDLTVGPSPTHVGHMVGSSGDFQGLAGDSRESISLSAFSLQEGRTDMHGSLLIADIDRAFQTTPE